MAYPTVAQAGPLTDPSLSGSAGHAVAAVPQHLPYFVDEAARIVAVIGAFAGFLPSFVAFLAAVWYLILISEWLARRRIAKAAGTARKQVLDEAEKAREVLEMEAMHDGC